MGKVKINLDGIFNPKPEYKTLIARAGRQGRNTTPAKAAADKKIEELNLKLLIGEGGNRGKVAAQRLVNRILPGGPQGPTGPGGGHGGR